MYLNLLTTPDDDVGGGGGNLVQAEDIHRQQWICNIVAVLLLYMMFICSISNNLESMMES